AARDPRDAWEHLDCPVCDGTRFTHLFDKGGEPFVRCAGCGLVLINPRPSFAAIRAGYDAAYSAGYTRKADKKLARARRRVARVRRRQGVPGRWLDVGCSAGFVVRAAADAGYDAHGVDIEHDGIAWGRQQLGLANLREGLLDEQGYAAASFDVISLYDVIEHVPDLNAFVAELARLLAPGGVIDLGTPDLGHWRVPRPLARWGELKPSEHLYYFNRTTLARLLARHGLVIEHVRLALKPGLKAMVRHA
ncbi:MAG: class I SAM-dependent methyltransferase, partial [Gammaproteobacteria bacterium]